MDFGSAAGHWRGYPAPQAHAIPRERFEPEASRPASAAFQPYRNLFKRVLDLGLILLALPVVLPFVALMALLIARDGHNPFFRQDRVGLGGRTFTIWKLRTMVPDAERILQDHIATCPESRREWELNQKLRNDPRITPLGGLLRKLSLDELPQLWNVVKGDMSLVGPRPMMPCQQALYPGEAYYTLRPGLTGFWQISKRNDTAFAARAEFDTAYANAVSLGTDVRVLISTVGVVVRGTGL